MVKKNLLYKSIEDAAKRLLTDIKAFGIKLPDQMNWVHINTVFNSNIIIRDQEILCASY